MYTVPKLEDYSPEILDREIAQLLQVLEGDANSVQTSNDWKEFRDRWLARKNGVLTQVNEWLKAAPGPQKREVGRRLNELKAKG